ncbi:zinc finger protein Xfin-like [Centruroides vittatus]|uniref:zinc finger protein Xfin-like n=1 Tax=Centruroides vittatus TaxID=120091 RepID=UPI00350F2FC6
MDSQHQIKNTATQQKEFQCPVCLKFFSRKFTLEMHFLIHQGVKPHACPFCGKCFRQKGTLMRHKALHSSTALFHCGLCNRSFRQKNVFLHHLKHRHKVSTENLDRRKWRTQIADGESLMNTLPSFASADTIAISTSDKNLENMLFNTYYTFDNHSQSNDVRNKSVVFNTNNLSNQNDGNNQENILDNSTKLPVQAASDKKFSDYFNKNIPQPNSIWQCNVCNYEIPFDYLTCSAHVSVHEQKFKYKCCLCLRLFLTNSEYHQHMTLFHGNSKLVSKESSSCSKFSMSQNNAESIHSQLLALPSTSNSNIISSENNDNPKASTYFNNGEMNKQSSSIDSHLIQQQSKAETTFTCIPCQMDFTVEEDFECHVKTHVQSVLLSDSESIEVDSSNNNESAENSPSSGKVFHYPNETSSNMLSVNDDNINNIMRYLPSDIAMNSEAGRQNHLDNIIIHNNTKTSQSYDHDIMHKSGKYKQEKLELEEYLNNNEQTFHTINSEYNSMKLKYCTTKDFPNEKVTVDSSGYIEPSGLQTSNIKTNIKFMPNSNTNSSMYFNAKYLKSTPRKTKPLQKIDSENQFLNDHTNVLYLCPFCKKYFSTAERLCCHTMLHVRSVKSKTHQKITTTKKFPTDGKLKLPKENCSYSVNSKECITTSLKSKEFNNSNIIEKTGTKSKIFSSKIKQNCYQNRRKRNNTLSPNEMDSATSKWFKKNVQVEHKTNSERSSYGNHFKCKQCKKIFVKKSIYYYHMQMHLKTQTFHCLICHKKFLYKEQLLRHSRTNHLKTYKCQFCCRVFQYNVLYRYHKKFCRKKNSLNDLKSVAGDLSIPIIDILKVSNIENLIGIIPITNMKKTENAASEKPPVMAGIPVLSPLRPYQIDVFPVIGNLPL